MSDDLTPAQAAARIGATTRSVQRWIVSGRLPARRVGGRWRVANDAIDAFTKASMGDAAAPRAQAGPAHPIRTLFIANRGEIARRIAATCVRLGIGAVAPGVGGQPEIDLLAADEVIAAARVVGADALHPGYGFLSESAAFARAVANAGIRWVGPPADAIAAVGDKAAARRLAASLGVPIVPGYDADEQADATLTAEAARIGYPLVIKPAAGGGGKGMRTVRDIARFGDALGAARREAALAFGDDRVVLERLVEGARHVEIQILSDAHGHGVHLGERDCSIQRRHQKVLEEAPSPAVGTELRARLGAAALTLAGAVGYVGAGTCEFLLDDRGTFYFLEVNARLQVEHGVTEAIAGRDLVADQLAIAGGSTLAAIGLDQATVDRTIGEGRHAIEVRLYAEDAEDGFLPATGPVVDLRWPSAASAFGWSGDVRVDAGIDRDSEVGGRFDPMLAKILARGATRDEALDRLTTALDETALLGLVTNLRFLRWLVRSDVVRAGQARIDTLDRIWPPDDWPERAAIPDDAWGVAAASLIGVDDHAWSGGWRLNAAPRVRLVADGVERDVTLERDRERAARPLVVTHGAVAYVDVAGRSVSFTLAPPPDVDRAASAVYGAAGAAALDAPMPGLVLAVHASSGEAVTAGAPIVTLEAMKMEHTVSAPIAGIVEELAVRAGDQVVRGQVLARVVPAE
jgi:acetyl-CoA/propionyl-CoA carboxylase, biotin carboxylase, biotin carboxyl carrier protein